MNQVSIRDFGPFIIVLGSPSNKLGIAIEKGGIVARLEEIGDRVFIVLEKWLLTRREVIDQIPEDLLSAEARGQTPQETLGKVMQILVTPQTPIKHAA
jgi:hypothetical protein